MDLEMGIQRPDQFFLLAISLFSTLMACFAVPLHSIITDESALLAFKSKLSLDPSHVLSQNWSDSLPTCKWIGVTCSSRHQRVSALDISNLGLSGNLPSQLGNLSFLVSLNLRNNSFRGQLPKELAQLRRLRFLDFGFNDFNGDIPSWFNNLVELRLLNLRNNSFTGSIPSSISNMSKIEAIDMSFNPLQGRIPEAIGGLFNLKKLLLQFNGLTGVIPPSIFNMSAMETLAFAGNSFSGSLPEGMCRGLSNLKWLSLASNELEGPIPPNISECSQLSLLSLSQNTLTGTIPREIGNLRALETFYLVSNHLTGEIPEDLGNLDKLKELGMGNNFLVGSIPSTIFNISSLQYIDISDCNLTGPFPSAMCSPSSQLESVFFHVNEIVGHLPESIGECSKIQTLSLSFNNITGNIPEEIGNLTMMQNLYLGYNKLTGIIPEQIVKLYNLEVISLENNNLTGYIPEKIFNISTLSLISVSFNQFSGYLPLLLSYGLPNLQKLYLNDNLFFGEIPESISNFSKLTFITFAYNNLKGQIPNSFGKLNLLEDLHLDDNNFVSETSKLSFITPLKNCSYLRKLSFGLNPFNGILPASVGNLSTSIQYFGADKCGFRGSIPEEFGNLENLVFLYLDLNELMGAIPNTLGNLKKLQGLTLSGNKISGSVPNSLCFLQNLSRLWLQQNQISGSIPECVGNLTSVSEIYLGNNRLNSVIPTSLWKLNDLVMLGLSSNFLTGFLPSDIGNLKVVTALDLSENQLTGVIPSSIGDLESVANISLALNGFLGSIPESIGKLLGLEMLDLSHNNLSGSIPLSLEELRFLKYLDVSFNELSGPIPTGGPFKSLSSQFFMSNGGLCGDPKYGVPPCHENTVAESKRKKAILRAAYIFLGVSGLVSAIILSFILARNRKKNKEETLTESSFNTAPSRVPYHELVKATEGYNESHLLGTGSYGSVYKGRLQNGEDVAVKVFNSQSESEFKSFDTECEVLRRLRHRNLCKVIGSCSTEDFKALVLEYMPNGSLERWLYLENNFLNIVQRLNIMIDVACALEYLHHDYSIRIVHCDLKPSNVLLDGAMVAHLCDFGIAKLLSDGISITLTRTLATLGYIAPEYGSGGLVSVRCDVYSYGIMLMEVFTRMKPNDVKFTGDLSLRRWVNECMPNAIMQVIDSELLRADEKYFSEKLDCLVSIMEIGLKCSTENPNERTINMKHIVVALKKIMSQLLQFLSQVDNV